VSLVWFNPLGGANLSTASPTTVNADVGALTLTGFAPTIRITISANADVGSLVLTGLAPTVQTPIRVLAGLGQLTLTGFAPTIAVSASAMRDPYGWFPGDELSIPGRIPGRRYEEYTEEEEQPQEEDKPQPQYTAPAFNVPPSEWKPDRPQWQPKPISPANAQRFEQWRQMAEQRKAGSRDGLAEGERVEGRSTTAAGAVLRGRPTAAGDSHRE
jgi:hypothetical protein